MVTRAVGIQQAYWQEWLHALSGLSRLREVEVPASLLRESGLFLPAADRHGVRVKSVRDLLSPEVARYLGELSGNSLAALSESVIKEFAKYRLAGVETVGSGCGLEKLPAKEEEKALRMRVELLKRLAGAAADQGLVLCVPLRYPEEVPDSGDWVRVVNIVHDVMHPACRLAVNIFPGELDPEFDPMLFMRNCGFRLGLLRICYEPALGEGIGADEISAWAHALKWHGFRGNVVFAPRISDPAAAAALAADIEKKSDLLNEAIGLNGLNQQ